jgi:hypothetical protein
MTPVLWATGAVKTEVVNPDTAAPASASRRLVSTLILSLPRSFMLALVEMIIGVDQIPEELDASAARLYFVTYLQT